LPYYTINLKNVQVFYLQEFPKIEVYFFKIKSRIKEIKRGKVLILRALESPRWSAISPVIPGAIAPTI